MGLILLLLSDDRPSQIQVTWDLSKASRNTWVLGPRTVTTASLDGYAHLDAVTFHLCRHLHCGGKSFSLLWKGVKVQEEMRVGEEITTV